MHFSLLSLVISVVALTASAAVGGHCWLTARRRDRCRDEWVRLGPALRGIDAELDRLWVTESLRRGRRH